MQIGLGKSEMALQFPGNTFTIGSTHTAYLKCNINYGLSKTSFLDNLKMNFNLTYFKDQNLSKFGLKIVHGHGF